MKKNVAVVGSGFGGLATAIRLQASGLQVTVYDKRDKPGGRAYVYEQDGFVFDGGPTVITAPEALRELWELSGRSMDDYVELEKISPMYKLFWEDGTVFDYSDDMDRTLNQIRALNPEDAERYPAFLDYTREVFEEGYTKLAHVPFLHWSTMVKVSPQLVRLQAYRSVYSIVGKYLKDPHLRQVFSFHSLLVGGNPFSTSSIYTLIHYLERKWGVYFAKGGTGALIQGLVRLFEDLGGEIHQGQEVEEITTSGGRVTGLKARGTFRPFDAVVSNGDVVHTYRDLLGQEPAARSRARALAKKPHSMSLFVIYFGTRRKYPGLAHHNILFGARYRELLKDIFRDGVLADDFSLYLHAPTKTDTSLAPSGCENFYVLSPVPHLGKADIDWEVEGPKYRDKIFEYLEERYLPDLRRELVTHRILTPLDFKEEMNSHWGSAFSLEPLLTQSAYFRVHNRDPNIRGLYFVGAGTHPGAGIPGVVGSAKATSGLVLEDLRPSQATVAEPAELVEECQQMIEVGSKSFSLASRFFPEEKRHGAWLLYGWCRYCDDQFDKVREPEQQKIQLERVRTATRKAFEGETDLDPVFQAMGQVARQHRIPYFYAEELLEGMRMDMEGTTYRTPKELEAYCYRVAGTVGLMMSHIMGVSDSEALRHASHMGMAMQLTNISRDVREDAAMGRVYLPTQWLDEAGVRDVNQSLEPVAAIVARLLDLADTYYQSGREGLKYLPLRCAIPVAIAMEVYRDIGHEVRRRGSHAWDKRTVVSFPRKVWLAAKGIGVALTTVPGRLWKPWKAQPIDQVWRHA